jgi:hypothetical protein
MFCGGDQQQEYTTVLGHLEDKAQSGVRVLDSLF